MVTKENTKKFKVHAYQAGFITAAAGGAFGSFSRGEISPTSTSYTWNSKKSKQGMLLGTGVYAGVKTAQRVKKRRAKNGKANQSTSKRKS